MFIAYCGGRFYHTQNQSVGSRFMFFLSKNLASCWNLCSNHSCMFICNEICSNYSFLFKEAGWSTNLTSVLLKISKFSRFPIFLYRALLLKNGQCSLKYGNDHQAFLIVLEGPLKRCPPLKTAIGYLVQRKLLL